MRMQISDLRCAADALFDHREHQEGDLLMKLEELVEQFALNVAAQTEAIWRGDAKTGNKHARKYGAAVDKPLAPGNAGRGALLVLLKHERMDVRVMATAHLLRYRTAEAKAVLDELRTAGTEAMGGRHLGP